MDNGQCLLDVIGDFNDFSSLSEFLDAENEHPAASHQSMFNPWADEVEQRNNQGFTGVPTTPAKQSDSPSATQQSSPAIVNITPAASPVLLGTKMPARESAATAYLQGTGLQTLVAAGQTTMSPLHQPQQQLPQHAQATPSNINAVQHVQFAQVPGLIQPHPSTRFLAVQQHQQQQPSSRHLTLQQAPASLQNQVLAQSVVPNQGASIMTMLGQPLGQNATTSINLNSLRLHGALQQVQRPQTTLQLPAGFVSNGATVQPGHTVLQGLSTGQSQMLQTSPALSQVQNVQQLLQTQQGQSLVQALQNSGIVNLKVAAPILDTSPVTSAVQSQTLHSQPSTVNMLSSIQNTAPGSAAQNSVSIQGTLIQTSQGKSILIPGQQLQTGQPITLSGLSGLPHIAVRPQVNMATQATPQAQVPGTTTVIQNPVGVGGIRIAPMTNTVQDNNKTIPIVGQPHISVVNIAPPGQPQILIQRSATPGQQQGIILRTVPSNMLQLQAGATGVSEAPSGGGGGQSVSQISLPAHILQNAQVQQLVNANQLQGLNINQSNNHIQIGPAQSAVTLNVAAPPNVTVQQNQAGVLRRIVAAPPTKSTTPIQTTQQQQQQVHLQQHPQTINIHPHVTSPQTNISTYIKPGVTYTPVSNVQFTIANSRPIQGLNTTNIFLNRTIAVDGSESSIQSNPAVGGYSLNSVNSVNSVVQPHLSSTVLTNPTITVTTTTGQSQITTSSGVIVYGNKPTTPVPTLTQTPQAVLTPTQQAVIQADLTNIQKYNLATSMASTSSANSLASRTPHQEIMNALLKAQRAKVLATMPSNIAISTAHATAVTTTVSQSNVSITAPVVANSMHMIMPVTTAIQVQSVSSTINTIQSVLGNKMNQQQQQQLAGPLNIIVPSVTPPPQQQLVALQQQQRQPQQQQLPQQQELQQQQQQLQQQQLQQPQQHPQQLQQQQPQQQQISQNTHLFDIKHLSPENRVHLKHIQHEMKHLLANKQLTSDQKLKLQRLGFLQNRLLAHAISLKQTAAGCQPVSMTTSTPVLNAINNSPICTVLQQNQENRQVLTFPNVQQTQQTNSSTPFSAGQHTNSSTPLSAGQHQTVKEHTIHYTAAASNVDDVKVVKPLSTTQQHASASIVQLVAQHNSTSSPSSLLTSMSNHSLSGQTPVVMPNQVHMTNVSLGGRTPVVMPSQVQIINHAAPRLNIVNSNNNQSVLVNQQQIQAHQPHLVSHSTTPHLNQAQVQIVNSNKTAPSVRLMNINNSLALQQINPGQTLMMQSTGPSISTSNVQLTSPSLSNSKTQLLSQQQQQQPTNASMSGGSVIQPQSQIKASSTPIKSPPPGKLPISATPALPSTLKIGNNSITLNMTPQQKDKLQQTINKMPREQQQLFYKQHIQQLQLMQQQLKLQQLQQLQIQQQQQQQQQPGTTKLDVKSAVIAQLMAKGLQNVEKAAAANESPPKGTKRPAVVPPITSLTIPKASIIHRQLTMDQHNALRCDSKTPFKSYNEACRRLLRFHVMQDRTQPVDEVEQEADEFDERSKELLQKKSQMMDKFRFLLFEESMKTNPSAEMVMIERMVNQDLTTLIAKERKTVEEDPDSFELMPRKLLKLDPDTESQSESSKPELKVGVKQEEEEDESFNTSAISETAMETDDESEAQLPDLRSHSSDNEGDSTDITKDSTSEDSVRRDMFHSPVRSVRSSNGGFKLVIKKNHYQLMESFHQGSVNNSEKSITSPTLSSPCASEELKSEAKTEDDPLSEGFKVDSVDNSRSDVSEEKSFIKSESIYNHVIDNKSPLFSHTIKQEVSESLPSVAVTSDTSFVQCEPKTVHSVLEDVTVKREARSPPFLHQTIKVKTEDSLLHLRHKADISTNLSNADDGRQRKTVHKKFDRLLRASVELERQEKLKKEAKMEVDITRNHFDTTTPTGECKSTVTGLYTEHIKCEPIQEAEVKSEMSFAGEHGLKHQYHIDKCVDLSPASSSTEPSARSDTIRQTKFGANLTLSIPESTQTQYEAISPVLDASESSATQVPHFFNSFSRQSVENFQIYQSSQLNFGGNLNFLEKSSLKHTSLKSHDHNQQHQLIFQSPQLNSAVASLPNHSSVTNSAVDSIMNFDQISPNNTRSWTTINHDDDDDVGMETNRVGHDDYGSKMPEHALHDWHGGNVKSSVNSLEISSGASDTRSDEDEQMTSAINSILCPDVMLAGAPIDPRGGGLTEHDSSLSLLQKHYSLSSPSSSALLSSYHLKQAGDDLDHHINSVESYVSASCHGDSALEEGMSGGDEPIVDDEPIVIEDDLDAAVQSILI